MEQREGTVNDESKGEREREQIYDFSGTNFFTCSVQNALQKRKK